MTLGEPGVKQGPRMHGSVTRTWRPRPVEPSVRSAFRGGNASFAGSKHGAAAERAVRVVACAIVIELSFGVRVDGPPGRVFAVLTDFESYLARWAAGPIAARRTSPGATGEGTQFVVTARVGPFRVRSPYEVLSWRPSVAFSGRGIAGPVRFEEKYELSDASGSTDLTQSIRASPRGPFRIIEPLIARQLRRLIASDLERFKALVLEVCPE
jgi:Polyketide cyclase / dehydrase and lipid transport